MASFSGRVASSLEMLICVLLMRIFFPCMSFFLYIYQTHMSTTRRIFFPLDPCEHFRSFCHLLTKKKPLNSITLLYHLSSVSESNTLTRQALSLPQSSVRYPYVLKLSRRYLLYQLRRQTTPNCLTSAALAPSQASL